MKRLFEHVDLTKAEKTVLTAILLLLIILMFFKCKQQVLNPLVLPATIQQPAVKVKLNDSTVFFKQEALLAQTQEQVHILNDKLQEALIQMMKLSKVSTSIEYRDSICYVKVPGKRVIDSFYYAVDSSNFPMTFRHEGKYFSETYRVINKDSSVIDSIKIIGKGHIVVGETGKWYQKKRLVVGLMNENPYYMMDSVRSVVYKSRDVWQVGVGPIFLLSKNSTSVGIGLSAKKGIFSFSIGYKLF